MVCLPIELMPDGSAYVPRQGEVPAAGYVYVFPCCGSNRVKIGSTRRPVEKRLAQIQGNSREVTGPLRVGYVSPSASRKTDPGALRGLSDSWRVVCAPGLRPRSKPGVSPSLLSTAVIRRNCSASASLPDTF